MNLNHNISLGSVPLYTSQQYIGKDYQLGDREPSSVSIHELIGTHQIEYVLICYLVCS